jgi:hypothetical protein
MFRPSVLLLGRMLALIMLALLVSGCGRAINIENKSSKAASVYVSIPEQSGRSMLRLDPGASDSAELGDSGIYTVYVLADETVTTTLTKVRDDIEAQLKQATTPAEIAKLTSQLQAINKYYTILTNRATSCGGKVAEGDAYVTIGWSDSLGMFSATCISQAADAP